MEATVPTTDLDVPEACLSRLAQALLNLQEGLKESDLRRERTAGMLDEWRNRWSASQSELLDRLDRLNQRLDAAESVPARPGLRVLGLPPAVESG